MTTTTWPTWGSGRAGASRVVAMPLVVLTLALSIAVLAVPPPAAQAANVAVDQCNDVGPGPGGATTLMTCMVTVVNTISGDTTSSTVTATRQCSLDPCAPGNGTFVTSSTDLVTAVNQCNGSGNDAAHPIRCVVTITNNISAGTPGAESVTPATVNQCAGSGAGGGGTVDCSPFPATTTDATVTQCNGSGNGGGGTVDCEVASDSAVSPAIPVAINQCNGTGNPGGTVVTCSTSITTNIIAQVPAPAPSPPAQPIAAPVPAPTSPGTPPSNPAVAPPNGVVRVPTARDRDVPGRPSRNPRVPSGGIHTGGGATAGQHQTVPQTLAGGLLLAATVGALLRWRGTRRG
jgi:hypothetical protein